MNTTRDTLSRTIRLGTILVQRGLLDEHQVQRVLQAQQRSGEPFGLLCERLLGISPEAIESAWAMQYSTLVDTTDLSRITPTREVIACVTRRQAWQFRVIPVSCEDGELTLATTRNDLCRALRFATNVIGRSVYFVMATSADLDEALEQCYPIPGMEAVRKRAA